MNYELLKRYIRQWMIEYVKKHPLGQSSLDPYKDATHYQEDYHQELEIMLEKMSLSTPESTPEQ